MSTDLSGWTTLHRPKAWTAAWNELVHDNLEPVFLVKGHVPRFHRLEVAGQTIRSGASQDRLDQRTAYALALPHRFDAQDKQVPVRLRGIPPVQLLHITEHIPEPLVAVLSEHFGKIAEAGLRHALVGHFPFSRREPESRPLDFLCGGIRLAE